MWANAVAVISWTPLWLRLSESDGSLFVGSRGIGSGRFGRSPHPAAMGEDRGILNGWPRHSPASHSAILANTRLGPLLYRDSKAPY